MRITIDERFFYMARPMILMRPQLLNAIHAEHKLGVPVVKLLKRYNLNITSPTLAKLLTYRRMLDKANSEADVTTAEIIQASLYPAWLVNQSNDIMYQPATHYYTGTMPLGEWRQHDWSD